MNEDINITDSILERPFGFSVDYVDLGKKKKNQKSEKHFYLYPVTLGKMLLLQSLVESLEINQYILSANSSFEALRLASQKKDTCLSIIVYGTCKTKDEVFDLELLRERKEFFSKNLTEEEIASLILVLLSHDKTNSFMHHLKIDKEQDRMSAVMRTKGSIDKNNVSFGGMSMFGTLLDVACERYGWTKEYVVWGIDYSSLRLMLADKITTMYLSDEELKKVPKWALTEVSSTIKADDPKNKELIKSMNWR